MTTLLDFGFGSATIAAGIGNRTMEEGTHMPDVVEPDVTPVASLEGGRLDIAQTLRHVGDMANHDGQERIASLDLLRVLACACVLISHGDTQLGWPSRALMRQWPIAALGVECFFVLSGFLITRILLREKEQAVPVGYFLLRRAARIFPAYYALLITASSVGYFWPALAAGRGVRWSHWVYVFNIWKAYNPTATPTLIGHTYTLCIEEHFYVLWPLVVWLLSRRGSRMFLLCGVMPAALLRVLYLHDAAPSLQFSSLARFLTLGAGALMAYHEGWVRSPASRPLTAVLIVMGALLWPAALPFTGFRPNLTESTLSRTALAAGSVLLCLSVVEPLTYTRLRGLRARWLGELGMMSYGIYLWHPIAYLGVSALLPAGQWYSLVLAVAGTLLIALASYGLLERPLIRYAGRRFRVGRPTVRERNQEREFAFAGAARTGG